jgi:ATP-dependent DNA helicase HFM1/MER3
MANGLATTNAKTRRGWSVSPLGSEIANARSCKHFCCREGLDKPPPKPKKRALPGTQKEDGLNQLTISASITKTPAIGSNAGTHERNQRTTEVKNSENFSKTKTSTPQPGKKPLNQVSSVLLEKDKNVPIKKKRPETPKPFSSDYGDDSLDELISPSQLFGKTGSSFARLPSPMTSIQAMNNGADVVPVSTDKKNTDSPELPVFQTNIQVKKSKPSIPKTQPEVIEISDDTPSEATSIENENAKPEPTTPGHDITPEATSIENAEPEPTTPEQSTISLTSPEESHLKRQASEDEYQDSKRLKRTPFDSHFQAESPKHFKEIALDPEQPDLPVMRTWLDLNADWNDADIDMVKEFKDIIDFI